MSCALKDGYYIFCYFIVVDIILLLNIQNYEK